MSPHDGYPPIQIYDPGNAKLIAIGLAPDAPELARGFECCEGGGALLTYYFCQGKREVLVRHGANEGITARLGTRWVDGRREWMLDW